MNKGIFIINLHWSKLSEREIVKIPTTTESPKNGSDPLWSTDLDPITSNKDAVPYGLNDYKQALSLYEQGMDSKLKLLSLNHSDLLDSYNNIGDVYHTMDNSF